MKKYVSLILVLAMLLAAVFMMQACKSNDDAPQTPTEGQNDNNTQPVTNPDDDEWSSSTDTEWSDGSSTPETKPTEPTDPTEATGNTDTTDASEEWNEDEWSTESDVEWSE